MPWARHDRSEHDAAGGDGPNTSSDLSSLADSAADASVLALALFFFALRKAS